MYFKTKELILIGFIAAVMFIVNIFTFLISTTIGNPMIGGFGALFFAPLLGVIVYSPIKKPGTFLLMVLVYSFLAIPTPFVTGTPGFHKVLLFLFAGIVAETIFLIIKSEKTASTVMGGTVALACSFAMLFIFKYLGLPAYDKMLKFFAFSAPIMMIVGALGGFTGYKIYERIKNKPFIKRLQN